MGKVHDLCLVFCSCDCSTFSLDSFFPFQQAVSYSAPYFANSRVYSFRVCESISHNSRNHSALHNYMVCCCPVTRVWSIESQFCGLGK
jgi:hypothetical protein